jgi:hypothetical protein
MKTNIALCILLILFIGCAAKKELRAPSESVEIGKYYWAFQPAVNIRQENSSSSAKIGELSDGDSIMVLLNKDGWYKIKSHNMTHGWVRSDLLGPRNLSTFLKAAPFIDRLNEQEGIQFYFDKKLQHKCIYLSYPKSFYRSKAKIEKKTRLLTRSYQENVYAGDVTVHVLKPNSKKIYLSLDIKGSFNADIKLPILPFGQLERIDNNQPAKISLHIIIPQGIHNDRLLKTAREVASVYPISYSQVQVIFYEKENRNSCRLWYCEDKEGEKYQFDKNPL